MGSFVFNVAKGQVAAYHERVNNNDPATSALIWVLLKVTEADGTLRDRTTLAAILAGGNTECDFTNYAPRKTYTDSDIGPITIDHVNDRVDADGPDLVWGPPAGGALNNTVVRALLCYDSDTTSGTDANIIPLLAFDVLVSGSPPNTNGGSFTLQLDAAGYFRAT